ncbi:uncharacterized protein LOC129587131 [Paramacrobiotus metropolitanus]|uniref:uncharacterized protein LOC129587131 n=1 Tax=Paramacrobiotus metropolitanus TaxID=2943436 RepID=UPI002445E63B|nr:uncharacterized protein LOC129587131 [Paramacrobiotus metropolitanus]
MLVAVETMARIGDFYFILLLSVATLSTVSARRKKFPPSGFQQDPEKHKHQQYEKLEAHKSRHGQRGAAIVPATFDSRRAWPNCTSLSLIRDQGHCGNCWAVSAASVISDRLCIASGQTDQTIISASQVAGCTDTSRTPQQRCEAGGDPANAYAFVASRGVCSGGMYNSSSGCIPYSVSPNESVPQQCETRCTNLNFGKTIDQDQFTIDSYWTNYARGILNQSGILDHMRNMQDDILHNGPITAAIYVYEDFQTWNASRGPYCLPPANATLLGAHAVRIIGWDRTLQGVTYWLISNSWGEDVGDHGIYWIEAGKNCLGIENFISAPIARLPSLCTTNSFCDRAINQAVRVWQKDPASPVFLFQDNCVLAVNLNATDGTMWPIGNAEPIAKAIIGAPPGPINKWMSYNNQVILISSTNDAALDWKTIDWPKSRKTTSVGGVAGTGIIAQTYAGSNLYTYYSDALKHIYLTKQNGNFTMEIDNRIDYLLTSVFRQVYSFLDLSGKQLMVFGTPVNTTSPETFVGTLAYPNANFTTFTWMTPITPLRNYLKCS